VSLPAHAGERQGSAVAATAASADTRHNARAGYVGDDACRSCHADQFASCHQTAHYRTSMPPSHDSILASFSLGDNILNTANPKLFFRMEEQRVDGKSDDFFRPQLQVRRHTRTRAQSALLL
jgi:hypothetical protein